MFVPNAYATLHGDEVNSAKNTMLIVHNLHESKGC